MALTDILRTYCNETLNDYFECIRINILPILPCLFFWLLLPIFFAQIYRIRVNGGVRSYPLPWNTLLITKTVIMISLVTITLAKFAISLYDIGNEYNIFTVKFVFINITALTMFGLLCCILMARKNGMITSGIIHITFILFGFCGFPEYFIGWQEISNFWFKEDMSKVSLVIDQIWYTLIVIQVILFCFADHRKSSLIEAKKKLNLSPETESSFLNRLLLSWFTKIQMHGARKTLTVDDLYVVNENSSAKNLAIKWEKLWNPAIEDYGRRQKIYQSTLLQNDKDSKKKKGPEPPSIVWRLFLMFRFEILSATAIKIISDIMQLASPFFLNLLLKYISTGNGTLMEGITYMMALFVCAEIRSFLLNYYFYLMMRVGVKVQSTLMVAIYRKTLRLSSSARKNRTVGEIVNLMAIDVERLELFTPHIQQVWSSPFQITIILIYLFLTTGISAIYGVIVMILFFPLNFITSVFIKKWQAKQMKLKDERMKICNEILNGIKVIKLFAWEPAMVEFVEKIRHKELHLIRKTGITRAFIDSFNSSSPFFVAAATFSTYASIITPKVAFVSLTLFNQLRSPMAILAHLMRLAVQASVANKRVKSFLVEDELNPLTIDRFTDQNEANNAVEIKNASLNWNIKESEIVLEIDNFIVPKKSLIAVVGKVGSGKSSLLNAILGEMEKLKGHIKVCGQMAIVNQKPWIQNSTLRNNIVFGKQFDQKYYDEIIDACELIKDLNTLPNGDATEIGEKGINLSGGQKARVALARAIYQNRDIYLLDDPLSAVDSHVGKHIYKKVIGHEGLLKHKTRVLVTNNLGYLNEVDNIAYMQDGKLEAFGSYEKLLEEFESFAKFIEACRNENEKEQESKRENEINDSDDNSYSIECRESEVKKLKGENFVGSINVLTNDDERVEAGRTITIEKVQVGKVKLNVYMQYIRSATVLTSFLFLLHFALNGIFLLASGLWLSKW